MRKSFWVASICLFATASAEAQSHWVSKPISDDWTWFEDYVYLSATYMVACKPGCTCQVGMGVKAFGEPRGEKIRYTGEREITVLGLGSLHIRRVDGQDCKAAIQQKSNRLIPITDIKW